MVEIAKIQTTRQLKEFVNFPNKLYKGNPYYVPALFFDEINTLRADKNPAYEFCEADFFLARKNGRTAGRMGLILNRKANETWSQKRVRFTRLDFIDDEEVSGALLGKAEEWARQRGMEEIHGPMGFSDMDQEGMLVEGFDELSTMVTLYNHPYYMRHLERLGYTKDIDWVEYQLPVPDAPNEKLSRLAGDIEKRYGFRVVHFKKTKEILPYAQELFEVLNDAYKELYGVIHLTQAQIDSAIRQYFDFINPAFVKIVLDEEGRMAGFGIAIPSLSRALQRCGGRLFPLGWAYLLQSIRKNDRLDLYLVGVRTQLRNRGINALLMDAVTREAIRHGIRIVESNPELENNMKVRSQWKLYEHRQHRRRRCYVKRIAPAEPPAEQ